MACALFGFLLCYAILSRSFPQTRSKTHWGLVSKIMAWGFDRPETLVSRALTPVIENTTWHGTTLLSNFSSHLWFTQYGDLKLLSEVGISILLTLSCSVNVVAQSGYPTRYTVFDCCYRSRGSGVSAHLISLIHGMGILISVKV